jgi:single-strand DNA-binding protein
VRISSTGDAIRRSCLPGGVRGAPVNGWVAAARRNAEEGINMFETPITVVGNIVNDPHGRRVGDQEVMKFRVASNSRRRTADGTWEAGNSLFVTVNCWGKLVTGVGAALRKGDPVIVVGHVYTSEYEDRDGNRRSNLEMRATSVGPDLSRSIVRIIEKTSSLRDAAPAADEPESAETTNGDEASDSVADGEGLALSA